MAQFGSYPQTNTLSGDDLFLIHQDSSGTEKNVAFSTIAASVLADAPDLEFQTITVTPNTNGVPSPDTGVVGHFGNLDGTAAAVLVDGTGSQAYYILRSAGGTVLAPSATSGFIGGLAWQGWTGSGYSPTRAAINATTLDAPWTPTAQGVQLEFVVTGTGSTSTVQAAVLTSSGFQNTNIGLVTPAIGRFTGVNSPAYEVESGYVQFRNLANTVTGTPIGMMTARGKDPDGFSGDQAKISFDPTENWTGSAHGTQIRFYATPVGSTTMALAGTITSTGINATAIGATTPSTGKFTSISTTQDSGGMPGNSVSPINPAAFFYNSDAANTVVLVAGVGLAPSVCLQMASGVTPTPSAILNGQSLGSFSWAGYGATTYLGNTTIEAVATQNWTDTARGTQVVINVCANNSVIGGPGLTVAPTLMTAAGRITTGAPMGPAGAWRLGRASSVNATSPNRTIQVEVEGTILYIHAKTTND